MRHSRFLTTPFKVHNDQRFLEWVNLLIPHVDVQHKNGTFILSGEEIPKDRELQETERQFLSAINQPTSGTCKNHPQMGEFSFMMELGQHLREEERVGIQEVSYDAAHISGKAYILSAHQGICETRSLDLHDDLTHTPYPLCPEPPEREVSEEEHSHERDRAQATLFKESQFGIRIPARGGVVLLSSGMKMQVIKGEKSIGMEWSGEMARDLLKHLESGKNFFYKTPNITLHIRSDGVMEISGYSFTINTQHNTLCEHDTTTEGIDIELSVSLTHLKAAARIMARGLI